MKETPWLTMLSEVVNGGKTVPMNSACSMRQVVAPRDSRRWSDVFSREITCRCCYLAKKARLFKSMSNEARQQHLEFHEGGVAFSLEKAHVDVVIWQRKLDHFLQGFDQIGYRCRV